MTKKEGRAGRGRRWGTGVLVVVASILVLATTIGVWSARTLLDSERFASTVTDPLRTPEVANALAVSITNATIDALDAEQRLVNLLPDALDQLAPVIVGGVRSVVQDKVAEILSSDVAVNALQTSIEAAHRSVMKLLEGDGLRSGVTVNNGEVRLNLVPVVVLVIDRLQGLPVVPDVNLPTPGQGSPEEQVTALNNALGTNLPPTFAQPVIYSSDAVAKAESTVATAQRALALFKRAIVLLVILTVAAIAAALLVSPNRLRTVVQLGVGAALAALVAIIVVRRIEAKVPDIIDNAVNAAAAGTLVDSVLADLVRISWLIVFVGVFLAVVAFVTGRAERGQADAAVRFTKANPWVVGGILGAIALFMLVVAGVSWLSVVAVVLVVGGGLLAMRLLMRHEPAGRAAEDNGSAGPPPAEPPPAEPVSASTT